MAVSHSLCGAAYLVAVTSRARLAGGVPDQQEALMIVVLQTKVRDYDAWKPLFDEHEGVRAKYGLLGHTIYRNADAPNDLTLTFRIESRKRAEEFMRDPSLAEAMQRSGVLGEPLVAWLEEAESVSYAERRAA